MTPGFVSLVGAGPGDPDLLTRRAIHRLREADVVFFDGLVPGEVLRLAPQAAHQRVAKRAGRKELSQADINADLVMAARLGCRVVRLKSGDPFVLGRGGEEALALAEAGVPFEIVPGVSSATAAPALGGIPLTHRGVSSAFLVVSGHDPAVCESLLASLPPGSVTLVVLMGLGTRDVIARTLLRHGWDAVPAALVVNASQPHQTVWVGSVNDLASMPAQASPCAPGVIVIGPVVALRTLEKVHGCIRQA